MGPSPGYLYSHVSEDACCVYSKTVGAFAMLYCAYQGGEYLLHPREIRVASCAAVVPNEFLAILCEAVEPKGRMEAPTGLSLHAHLQL